MTSNRPWSVVAAAGTAAHHGFELNQGVGLVLQPELGLFGAGALWGTQIPLWAGLAWRGGSRWDGLLAAWSGAALAGGLVHYVLWPWRRGRIGLPVLTEAEGIPASKLPVYNAILRAWLAGALVSIATEVPRRDRKWVLAGFATMPLQILSARHHFTWLDDQATTRPAWWNRSARPR